MEVHWKELQKASPYRLATPEEKLELVHAWETAAETMKDMISSGEGDSDEDMQGGWTADQTPDWVRVHVQDLKTKMLQKGLLGSHFKIRIFGK